MKTALLALSLVLASADLFGGARPYEFDWANRTHDDHVPVVAMEDAAGWHVETSNSIASASSAVDRYLFGKGALAVVYRATGKAPAVRLRLDQPAKVEAFDTVSLWVYGNNVPDGKPLAAETDVFADFLDSSGRPLSVKVVHVRHLEWFLAQHRLSPSDIARVGAGARFLGFTIVGGTDVTDRRLLFTSFCAFKEEFGPVASKPRPRRPNRIFPDVPAGINSGEGVLPFPNRALTVVPPERPQSRKFIYRLPSDPCNWDDMAFSCDGGKTWQRFAVGGGLWFAGNKANPDSQRVSGAFVVTTNSVSPLDVVYHGTFNALCGSQDPARFRFHEEGQSMVVDFTVDGGNVTSAVFGGWENPKSPRLIPIPFYTYDGYAQGPRCRPQMLVTEAAGGPIFHLATMDWTQSNATDAYCAPGDIRRSPASNGGTHYFPRTDGRRNCCAERFVYSFADKFEDVLPMIPNPVSPWKHVTGSVVWHARGAGDREADKRFWRQVRTRGLKHVLVTDHEVGWRDGNESFTFRTSPAPKKGGDRGQYDFARVMIDELGFYYGPYNNFTDFAPVNGFWNPDRVSRMRDKQLQHAWNRCYAPKPTYGVTACEVLTPIIQRKFGFNTGYCDVHTTFAPWQRNDHDARIPGGGTFANVFYTFGEIMLIQKHNWNGPVYSEGGVHFMYMGLADGNYGQDSGYRIAENPWLVDFDLLRIHPLGCNFGMGGPGMFYPSGGAMPKDKSVANDRFLAATIAFGHSGYLLGGDETDMDRSYFMLQQLAARYTQADAEHIQYLERDGSPLDTSEAIVRGAYRRSQVLTRYSDGTITAVNGSTNEMMRIDGKLLGDGAVASLWLPPNGYYGASGDGRVLVYSGLIDGHRVDYSVSPEYVYLDARGVRTGLPGIESDRVKVRLAERGELTVPVNCRLADIAKRTSEPVGSNLRSKLMDWRQTTLEK